MRQAKCTNGKRAFCVTKYETMCTNKEVEYEMMEDHPRCRVELVEKCEESKPKLDFLSQMMHDKDKNKPKMECRKFPAMRCRIEKVWSPKPLVLFSWLFTIKDQCKKYFFLNTPSRFCVSCF